MLSYAKIATSELECKKHGCFEAAKNLTFELNTACTSLRSLKKKTEHTNIARSSLETLRQNIHVMLSYAVMIKT